MDEQTGDNRQKMIQPEKLFFPFSKNHRRVIFALSILLVFFFLTSIGCSSNSPTSSIPTSTPFRKVSNELNEATAAASHSSFIVFGDNRPEEATDPQPQTFKDLIALMSAEKTDLIVSTGDNVTGKTDDEELYRHQYREFLSIIKPLDIPFYSAAGNHDAYNELGQSLFREMISKDLYFSFDNRNSHFIVLDTDIIDERGLVNGKQYRWLQQDLKANSKAEHIFVFLHRPVFSLINPGFSGLKHQSFTDRANRDRLLKLFREAKVDIIFAGHEHFFNKMEQDGLMQVIAGCAGSSPYADAAHGGFPHYVLVEIKVDDIELTVVKSTGERLKPETIAVPEFK